MSRWGKGSPEPRNRLETRIEADNTAGDLSRKRFTRSRERDMQLVIIRWPGQDTLTFRLSGRTLQHGNTLSAQAPNPTELAADMHDLRTRWEEALHFRHQEGPNGKRGWQPLIEQVDFAGADWDPGTRVLPALAKAGSEAFDVLFSSDRGSYECKEMARLRDKLVEMLGSAADKSGCCLITIRPFNFYVPWTLLCVVPPGVDPGSTPDKDWFLGYRHQIEVRTSEHDNLVVELTVHGDELPGVAAVVDRTLDDVVPGGRVCGGRASCVEPVLETVRSAPADAVVCEERSQIQQLLQQGAPGVQLLYLGCHCDYDHAAGPMIHLRKHARDSAQRERLGRNDARWAKEEGGGPMLAVLNSCRGGLAHRDNQRGFVESLRSKGWFSALAAPETEIPIRFLGEYGERFLRYFLAGGEGAGLDVGTLVQRLAREFLDEKNNPLGLLYCVHRNLDTHLCREDPCQMTSTPRVARLPAS